MEEAIADPKVLENIMLKALSTFFPSHLGTTSNPAVEFYEKFQRAADDHDRDFIKKYDEDLNSTLIFAGLFSAVTSAFIIDVQSKLEPDFEEMNHILLKIVASSALGNTPTGANATLPEWNGPDRNIVHVQAILYSSLSASLLAAFIATLGKQWLNRYASVERGSIIDRGRRRKRKMDGMVTWKFGPVMECLPLMLQFALLLLGYALSNYLFPINKIVANVPIGFTVSGLLFYLLIISAATFSYNCPFQTPFTLILRSLVRFDGKHKKCLEQPRKWFGRIFSRKNHPRQSRNLPRRISSQTDRREFSDPSNFGGRGTIDAFGDQTELPMAGPPDQPPRLFNEETDWGGYVLDSDCITWMFKMPMDMDVSMVITRFIPDIVWHAGIQAVPLERLYEMVLECCDRSSGLPIVKPGIRDKAYLCAKALLHVSIQRKCIGVESENVIFNSISDRYQTVGSEHYEGDWDLKSTLGMINCVFGGSGPVYWRNRQNSSFTIPHHTWMGHILLCHAWDVIRNGKPLPEGIREFVLHSLRLEPPLPAPITADCLFIIGLFLGIRIHISDLFVVDKSHQIDPQIDRIYAKLIETFGNPSPTADEVNCALEVMELITPLPRNNVAQQSSNLFYTIMRSPTSLAYSEEKKWEASRLAMRGAYKWDKFSPWVKDPLNVIAFLGHHFDLITSGGENQDGPIQDALHALAYASSPATIKALKHFDPTEPSFIRGICHAYQGNKPFQLRKAALFFLPLIGDRWFNTPHPIMDPDQMRSLCADWASTVDGIEHTYDVQRVAATVFFGMINSPHWRPHIVPDKWKLLEYFTSVPDDSRPLRRCIDNPELMDVIKNVEDPAIMVLWLKILWSKYGELIPQVQEQLTTVTKEVARDNRRADLDACLTAMDSELRKAEDTSRRPRSTNLDDIALKTKVDNLRQARATLIALKG